METTMQYTTKDGDMLDEICHNYYGNTFGTVESVLKENPGLCELGPIYQAGVEINLPKIKREITQTLVTQKLWD